MAKQTIGIGSAANDGTGDPLRTAFSKVNDNFNEMYSSFDMTGKLTVGNSTVNTTISNTSGIRTGNSSYITTVNSTSFQISNSSGIGTLTAATLSMGSNVVANTTTFLAGNSTWYSTANNNTVRVANATNSSNLTPAGLAVGISVVNSTTVAVGSNVVVNSSAVSIGNSVTNVVITQTGITGSLSLGDVVITGNLTVNGTVTTVNTATLDVADLNITIAKNSTTSAGSNSAGITIAGANATIRYISDSNNIVFSHTVEIGNSAANGTINATNYTGAANNSSYLGGTAAANFIANTTGGLTQNSSGHFIVANTGAVVNSTGLFVNAAYINTIAANSASYILANDGIISNSSGVFVNGNTGLVVNTSGVFVNATYIGTLTANNSNNLGGVAAASYVQNTDSRTLSGNLYFTGANNVFAANTVGLGSSTIAANGYTYLPNGLKMNWGVVSANSSDGNVTFTSAFSTALYTITVTGTNTELTTLPVAIDANTTAALVRTSNTTSVNVYFTAIGS
jgi:hypothetical protein